MGTLWSLSGRAWRGLLVPVVLVGALVFASGASASSIAASGANSFSGTYENDSGQPIDGWTIAVQPADSNNPASNLTFDGWTCAYDSVEGFWACDPPPPSYPDLPAGGSASFSGQTAKAVTAGESFKICAFTDTTPVQEPCQVVAIPGSEPTKLIFGLGDSLSSGEGSGLYDNLQCDRSKNSYQQQVFDKLDESYPDAHFEFHHLACSGASIDQGLLGGFDGVNGGTELPPQVDQARRIANHHTVAAVMLSIGVNDLKFSAILRACASYSNRTRCQDEAFEGSPTLADWVETTLRELPARYKRLAAKLNAFVARDRVFILQYPDLLSVNATTRCANIYFKIVAGEPVSFINGDEIDWLYDHFYRPLNDAVRAAAKRWKWTLIPPPPAFSEHGYCAADTWVVQYEQSMGVQGNANGTMHPNAAGTDAIVNAVYPIVARVVHP